MLEAGTEAEAAALEAGRRMFARPVRFLLGVARLDQLPPADLPEVALAGRSNVGKSSLLNALMGRSGVARTSNTPGRTRELNFFEVGGRLVLVDMPGYGYAEAPKAVVEAWTRLVFTYLRGRPGLALVCLLVDARHGLKASDRETMKLLARAAVPYLVVLTKADLLRPVDLEARLAELRAELAHTPGALPEPLATSAKTRLGIDRLRAELAARAAPEPVAVQQGERS
ncbi:MAG: putative GTP-binding protein EngB [Geminicoccaceae bacterium]|nr:MAG: putative GTP-binding protein EngB [Geminicoccaceae bacterium]